MHTLSLRPQQIYPSALHGIKKIQPPNAPAHELHTYIKQHPVAILGTADKEGRPHCAAIFVYATHPQQLYFMTKSETKKFKNIQENPHVSLAIADSLENSTLQATGSAHIIHDARTIEMVMGNMAHIYSRSADWLPPIAKLRAGTYQVVSIHVDHIRLGRFRHKHAGSPTIYTVNQPYTRK